MIISSLSCGGAERVASIMANHWAREGWRVTLMTFDAGKARPFFELDRGVRHWCLDIEHNSRSLPGGVVNNLCRVRRLRGAIKMSAPDAVISFMDSTNVLTLMATRGLGLPVIVTEHLDPAGYSPGRAWERLRRVVYPAADNVVLLSQRSASYFGTQLRKGRISVIPNPILPPPKTSSPELVLVRRPAMIGIGRLTHQKGFDLMLRTFAGIKDRHPGWSLFILGEGPLRSELESLTSALGLTGRVSFPGAVKNIYDFLRQADLFVLSSRYEGFPVALGEAMSCGLPSIANDCRTGPREMIRHGVDGLLIESGDRKVLAAAMDRLMSDERERARLAARAPEVVERFSLEKIVGMWELLLRKVLNS